MACSLQRGGRVIRHCAPFCARRTPIASTTWPTRPAEEPSMTGDTKPKQLLHLVFGGELSRLDQTEFQDLDRLDIVGIYPNYATAYAALEGQGATDGRQCANALLHRPFAPTARSRCGPS